MNRERIADVLTNLTDAVVDVHRRYRVPYGRNETLEALEDRRREVEAVISDLRDEVWGLELKLKNKGLLINNRPADPVLDMVDRDDVGLSDGAP